MELEIDQDRFLQKYFLGPDGKPDRTKTPLPMVLVGLDEPTRVALGDADRIGDLQMKTALQGSRNIVVLGWCEERVLITVSILESCQGDGRYSVEGNLTAKDLARYRDTLSTSVESGLSLPYGAVGHYIVRSTEIEAQAEPESMHLAIMKTSKDGWMAAFNFEVLRGYMILDTTVSRLDARWVKSKTSNCRVIEWESDSGGDESDGEDELTVAAPKEDLNNGSPSIPRLKATPARKQKRSLTSPSEKPSKRRKIREEDHARLLFFRWYPIDRKGIAREGADDTQKGKLQFLDKGYTKFEGSFSGSFLGHKVSFQGFKVDREVDFDFEQ